LATAGIAATAPPATSARPQDDSRARTGDRSAGRNQKGAVSVEDFGAVGDGRTDDTAAIQAALNSGAPAVLLPSGRSTRRYLFSNLTIPFRVRVVGSSARGAVLYQMNGATGAALTFERGLASYAARSDISDGSYYFEDIGLDVASEVGLRISGGATASMFGSSRFRMVHRSHATLVNRPYNIAKGTIGIEADGGSRNGRVGPLSAPVYMADHFLGEIRGFETAIKASGIVNEWNFRSFWLLDNRVGFDLSDVSTWFVSATIESGVKNARAFVLRDAIGNVVIQGGRWELTQAESFGIEFADGVSASNLAVRNVNILIEGDGNALPGRKWVGQAPPAMVMEGSYFDAGDGGERYFCIAPAQQPVRLPSHVRLGGHRLGDARIEFGRDHDNAAVSVLKHDGSTLTADAPNGFKVAQPGPGEAWRQPFLLGNYCFWVDRAACLRMKAGYPVRDEDGVLVGSQA